MKKRFFVGILATMVLWVLLGQVLVNMDASGMLFTYKLSEALSGVVIVLEKTALVGYFPVLHTLGWLGQFINNGQDASLSFWIGVINLLCLAYLVLVVKLVWYFGCKLLKIR